MTKVRVRDAYRDLSSKELVDKAYELGANFEMMSYGCSQSTVAAIHELLEMDDVVVKVATSTCGGTANQFLGTCGALVGGVMVLDYFFGRPVQKMSYREQIDSNIETMMVAFEPPERLADRFWQENGTIICSQIHRRFFGRIFYLNDEEEMRKFDDLGGHSDPSKCRRIVGNTAKWVMEILLNKRGY